MIGYVTLGTNDLEKAKTFYDAVLGMMDAKRMMDEDTFCAWTTGEDQAALSVTQPHDKNAACVGNGVMVALAVDSRDKVDAVYKKAMEMGGSDEGPPGQRFEGFYAGYFRDVDGNKLNVFTQK